jgi:hypothetical protein
MIILDVEVRGRSLSDDDELRDNERDAGLNRLTAILYTGSVHEEKAKTPAPAKERGLR